MSADGDPKMELEKLVDSMVKDIFKADQCILINTGIGNESEQLNARNFGDLFGSI